MFLKLNFGDMFGGGSIALVVWIAGEPLIWSVIVPTLKTFITP